jgi:hypothetical protein
MDGGVGQLERGGDKYQEGLMGQLPGDGSDAWELMCMPRLGRKTRLLEQKKVTSAKTSAK